jgi:hypothetical protein
MQVSNASEQQPRQRLAEGQKSGERVKMKGRKVADLPDGREGAGTTTLVPRLSCVVYQCVCGCAYCGYLKKSLKPFDPWHW